MAQADQQIGEGGELRRQLQRKLLRKARGSRPSGKFNARARALSQARRDISATERKGGTKTPPKGSGADHTPAPYFTGTPPTGATAGAAGAFTFPAPVPGALPNQVPGNVAALRSLGSLGQTPGTPWTPGQFVVLGNSRKFYWDGAGWKRGIAPWPAITGVTPGAPGTFTPPAALPGSLPLDLAALQALGNLGQVAPWATGQNVLLGNGNPAHWDGVQWQAGVAPAPGAIPAPTGIVVAPSPAATPGELDLTWTAPTPPATVTIDHYRITPIAATGGPAPVAVDTPDTSTSFAFTGLPAGTYTFQIAAVQPDGTLGSPGTSAPPVAVPVPVAPLTAVEGTPGSFTGGPPGFTAPTDLAALVALGPLQNIVGDCGGWTTPSAHVALGDRTHAWWNGHGWKAGDFPTFPTGVDEVPNPAQFLPYGVTPPANLAELQTLGDPHGPGFAIGWGMTKPGGYVVLGNGSTAFWDGGDWSPGTAPTTRAAYVGPPTQVQSRTGDPQAHFLPDAPGTALPADLAALQALEALSSLGETRAWPAGAYVLLADGSSAHWDGAAWVAGSVPGGASPTGIDLTHFPGVWTPATATPPDSLAAANALVFAPSLGTDSWPAGVSVALRDEKTLIHWDGAQFQAGAAPGNNPVPFSTGITPGTPGTFTPAAPASKVPPSLGTLACLGSLGQTTAWAAGQSVTLGDGSTATWDGTNWIPPGVPGPTGVRGAPLSAPTNLTAALTAGTTNSVDLTWAAPTLTAGQTIDHYSITPSIGAPVDIPAGTLTATIPNLPPGSHTFQVQAVEPDGTAGTAVTSTPALTVVAPPVGVDTTSTPAVFTGPPPLPPITGITVQERDLPVLGLGALIRWTARPGMDHFIAEILDDGGRPLVPPKTYTTPAADEAGGASFVESDGELPPPGHYRIAVHGVTATGQRTADPLHEVFMRPAPGGIETADGSAHNFAPAGKTAPANLAALQAAFIEPAPLAPWGTNQFVTLGDTSKAHWAGLAWAAGEGTFSRLVMPKYGWQPGTTPPVTFEDLLRGEPYGGAVAGTPWTRGQTVALGDGTVVHWDGVNWQKVPPDPPAKGDPVTPPADMAALTAIGPLGETDAWTGGEYVVLGDKNEAYWNGTAWTPGRAPIIPTGVDTSKTLATFTPTTATAPPNLAGLNALGDLGQTVKWVDGQHVVLGDVGASHAWWNGTAWVAGDALSAAPVTFTIGHDDPTAAAGDGSVYMQHHLDGVAQTPLPELTMVTLANPTVSDWTIDLTWTPPAESAGNAISYYEVILARRSKFWLDRTAAFAPANATSITLGVEPGTYNVAVKVVDLLGRSKWTSYLSKHQASQTNVVVPGDPDVRPVAHPEPTAVGLLTHGGGVFTPSTAAPPKTLAELTALGPLDQTGQPEWIHEWVRLGDESEARWDGTKWVAGKHPKAGNFLSGLGSDTAGRETPCPTGVHARTNGAPSAWTGTTPATSNTRRYRGTPWPSTLRHETYAGQHVPNTASNVRDLRKLGAFGQTTRWPETQYISISQNVIVHWNGDTWMVGYGHQHNPPSSPDVHVWTRKSGTWTKEAAPFELEHTDEYPPVTDRTRFVLETGKDLTLFEPAVDAATTDGALVVQSDGTHYRIAQCDQTVWEWVTAQFDIA